MNERTISRPMLIGGSCTVIATFVMAWLELPFWPAILPMLAGGAWDIVGAWRNR